MFFNKYSNATPFFSSSKSLNQVITIQIVQVTVVFLSIECRTRYPLTNFEDRFGLRASVIDCNMCGFLYIGLIPTSSGQLAELIVHIIPLEYLYNHQILFHMDVITCPCPNLNDDSVNVWGIFY